MSRGIVQRVAKDHPELFTTNIVSNNYRALVLIRDALRAAGHTVEHVAKVSGERQYVPPGFGRVQVAGLDGVGYTVTGVSHDALYVDAVQHDVIGAANHLEEPITRDGKVVEASAVFNPVPREDWRNWNPPLPQHLEQGRPVDPMAPQPPPPRPQLTVPDYGSMGDDAFFVDKVGKFVEAEMKASREKYMNAGSASWIARAVHGMMASYVQHGDHRDADAIAKKVRNEMREVLGKKPL